MQQILSTDSSLVFVWHDNSGQTKPDNSKHIQTKVDTKGFTIDVADDAQIIDPLILISSAALQNTSKNIINIGKNARIQIIEYIMSDDVNADNNVTSEINCGEGSQVKHCILHQAKDNTEIKQQSVTKINLAGHSNLESNIFAFGGKISNIELNILLNGEHAQSQAGCLAYTHGTETQNVALKIDHMVPNCNSKSLSRGILKDASITDFLGRIVVHPGAKKSFADLQIKNILCSPKAQANHKPELEIYNDDVHCSHGASTGQMNEEALFYMRSRGIGLQEATAMLIDGFIQPAIVSCTIPAIADFVKGIIAGR
jgi:Fe-S cluster assembly protein SufD